MTIPRRASDRCTRRKLCSPGRPSAWQRENRCLFWQAIAQGRTSEEAAAYAGISIPLGPRWFRSSGGMPPTHLAPASPQPTARFLTFSEREEIAILLARGMGIRSIARNLGRSPSTISREIRRNAATRNGRFDYRASAAQWHAERAAQRPRQGKLASNHMLRKYVEGRLSGQIADAQGVTVAGRMSYGRSAAPFYASTGVGRPHGVASRFPIGFRSTIRRIPRCASATRRSINPCTFRLVAPCAGNLLRVCARAARCVCRANALVVATNRSSGTLS